VNARKDLVIAAEALCTTEPPYKSNLKRGLSKFIADDELEREEIAERIGKFYRLRGAIAHGGKKEIPLADVRIASGYKSINEHSQEMGVVREISPLVLR